MIRSLTSPCLLDQPVVHHWIIFILQRYNARRRRRGKKIPEERASVRRFGERLIEVAARI